MILTKRILLSAFLPVLLFGLYACAPKDPGREKMIRVSEITMFPLGLIQIHIPGDEPPTRPIVTFSHEQHEDMLCTYCHHAFFANEIIENITLPEEELNTMQHKMYKKMYKGDQTIVLVRPTLGNYHCSRPGCHTDRKAKSGRKSYYAAFHAETGGSCINCHIEEKKYGSNRRVPTRCNQCHVPDEKK